MLHRFALLPLTTPLRPHKQLQRRSISFVLLTCNQQVQQQLTGAQSREGVSKRYAIIGGGFAGVAVAHHLSLYASQALPVVVDLFDLAGLGAGGSGAAGGLLHPFSPKGKLLWNGRDAFQAALETVAAAERASQQDEAQLGHGLQQFVWRQDMLRLATDSKQAAGFGTLKTAHQGLAAQIQAISGAKAQQLLPGLHVDPSIASDTAAALLIKGGLVLQPQLYLRNIWRGCEQRLIALNNASQACLKLERVQSLAALENQHGPYDDVIVAAGAAAAVLPEVGDILPIRLCQGYGAEFMPGEAGGNDAADDRPGHTFPEQAPSLVGATYVGAQGSRKISVGATKQFGYTAHQALEECGRAVHDPTEIAKAEGLLRPAVRGLWGPSADWQVATVRTGVRALPQKTAEGAIPLAGRLSMHGKDGHPSHWIVGGLGARGLVYHAWLGALVAQAVHEGSEACLPNSLLRWRQTIS